MYCSRQMSLLVCMLSALLVVVMGRPDSGGHAPLPGPGLSYGGIPYGSMSGNVAEYFKRQAPPSRHVPNLDHSSSNVNYKPIEQWL